jgi:DNA-binding response OmpR family regulator
MAPTVTASSATTIRPRVLIVDDEPHLQDVLLDVIGAKINCRIFVAHDLAEAQQIIDREEIELLVADVHLPDGDGMSLLPHLRKKQPQAGAIVITGKPSVAGTINALRAGVIDFLPKPFNAQDLLERVNRALHRQRIEAKNDKRLSRLRDAVRRLNISRHTVTKKVDLLCNDLISAYGELSRQMEDVRNQEAFRKLMHEAADLEQLLCHAMDWILKRAGFCNVAIWLAADDSDFQLGAYMKYTITGEPALTDAIKKSLLPLISREGFVHLGAEELVPHLSADLAKLAGQSLIGTNCAYLGETLATLVLFRDAKSPFTDEDAAMIKAICPIFATALASIVRQSDDDEDEDDDDNGGMLDDEPSDPPRRKKKESRSDADWWMRGEPPPFLAVSQPQDRK